MTRIHHIRTSVLDIAFEAHGPDAAPTTVVLLHGFPYDPRAFDEVAPALADAGCRVLVPYLRGYGPTRFIASDTPRSGQQAALAHDLIEMLDVLGIGRALLAGYDWGGRAACIAAALWPQRVQALVTCCGYQIQDIAAGAEPADPRTEHRLWYQYYFHTARGRAGLTRDREAISRELWRLWSPGWHFDDETFCRSARSWHNPDFVEVVLHSYQHRFGSVPGDPRYEAIERRLAARPVIGVPTIALHGAQDGVNPPDGSLRHERYFTAAYERRVLEGVGHNPPQESPRLFVQAIQDLMRI